MVLNVLPGEKESMWYYTFILLFHKQNNVLLISFQIPHLKTLFTLTAASG